MNYKAPHATMRDVNDSTVLLAFEIYSLRSVTAFGKLLMLVLEGFSSGQLMDAQLSTVKVCSIRRVPNIFTFWSA